MRRIAPNPPMTTRPLIPAQFGRLSGPKALAFMVVK